jgi:photosystem II stability/assembly factor-like uncharacterized protein
MLPRLRGSAVLCLALVLPLAGQAARLRDNLYGIATLGSQHAWVVGNFGSIHHTADGGKVWQLQKSGTKMPLFDVAFADDQRGWIVGAAGLILRTSDGGATWTTGRSPVPGDKHLFNVAAVDARTVWAVGDWGAITVTHDGGETWVDRSLGILTVSVADSPNRAMQTVTDDVILYDVMFVDADHGFIAGEFGSLFATRDGGATWRRQVTGTDKTLFGVHFVSPDEGWVVGIDGIVMRTTDGAESWQVQRGLVEAGAIGDLSFVEAMENPGLYAVHFAGSRGVVVGDTGSLFVSDDRGRSWARRALPDRDRLTWLRDAGLWEGGAGLLVGAAGFSGALGADGTVDVGAEAAE